MEHCGVVDYDTASKVIQFLALQETLCLHLKGSGLSHTILKTLKPHNTDMIQLETF